MSNKMKHLSIFAAAIAMAGLLLAGGALAEMPKRLPDTCKGLELPPAGNGVVFAIGSNGHLTSYQAGGTFPPRRNPFGSPNGPRKLAVSGLFSINVIVSNPEICYTAGGERICITY